MSQQMLAGYSESSKLLPLPFFFIADSSSSSVCIAKSASLVGMSLTFGSGIKLNIDTLLRSMALLAPRSGMMFSNVVPRITGEEA